MVRYLTVPYIYYIIGTTPGTVPYGTLYILLYTVRRSLRVYLIYIYIYVVYKARVGVAYIDVVYYTTAIGSSRTLQTRAGCTD